MLPSSFTPISGETMAIGLESLCSRDPALAAILAQYGPPPLWDRKPGFPTLLHTILEQQVSLSSAGATYQKLLAVASPLTPERFLELDDAALKAAGFSRQKARYGRELAVAIHDGRLSLDSLQRLDDDAARAELTQLVGIGRWTADIYLLLALRRPDIWPVGDLALAIALQEVLGLDAVPTQHEMETIGTAWQPWRAVAARLLWHYYLSSRRASGQIPAKPAAARAQV
jgi:DNA-3-methyladenine glycosylase II